MNGETILMLSCLVFFILYALTYFGYLLTLICRERKRRSNPYYYEEDIPSGSSSSDTCSRGASSESSSEEESEDELDEENIPQTHSVHQHEVRLKDSRHTVIYECTGCGRPEGFV